MDTDLMQASEDFSRDAARREERNRRQAVATERALSELAELHKADYNRLYGRALDQVTRLLDAHLGLALPDLASRRARSLALGALRRVHASDFARLKHAAGADIKRQLGPLPGSLIFVNCEVCTAQMAYQERRRKRQICSACKNERRGSGGAA